MKLWQSLADLIRSWWNVDRIRVSPDEGRLLRLDAGALLTIEGRALEVLRRRVRRRRKQTLITYTCRTDSGPARLLVAQPHHDRTLIVQWAEAGTVHRLHEPDITVWRTHKPQRNATDSPQLTTDNRQPTTDN